MNNRADTLAVTLAELRLAIDEQRLRPAYQPIIELATGQVVAEEALARIITPEGDVIPAEAFIQMAEERGLVHLIDHQLISHTVRRCVGQLAGGASPIDHFVNISADLLEFPALVQSILDLAVQSCTSCFASVPEKKPLVIEITERQLLTDIPRTREVLAPFLDFGLRLAIDDFGSGYSSLLYLADLPVTFLKLEGELVRRAPHEPKVRAILRGVQDLAQELEVKTIGEFIEDERTLDCVREIGIDWAQGHHLGRPEVDHRTNWLDVGTT
ncbi:MAG: EAL domain-containing protein [Chromatiales bacterium]|nr:EAL domain-containing protein [Chromatiales bacterium]